jgi:hypothetical protein
MVGGKFPEVHLCFILRKNLPVTYTNGATLIAEIFMNSVELSQEEKGTQ